MQFIDADLFKCAVECSGYIRRYFDSYFKQVMGGRFGYNGPFVAVSMPFTARISPFHVYSHVKRMDGKPIRD